MIQYTESTILLCTQNSLRGLISCSYHTHTRHTKTLEVMDMSITLIVLIVLWVYQFSCSFTQSCPALRNSMNCSTPGFPVHHQLLELAQTHVHQVSDAIQPSHPLSSPSPPAFNFFSIRIFSNESVLPIRWPKYWSFNSIINLPVNIQD